MTSFALPLTQAVTLVDDRIYESQWRPQIDRSAALLVEMNVRDVQGEADFFAAATVGLQLAYGGAVESWDALRDTIIGNPSASWVDGGAIVLRHADAMVAAALGVLLQAVGLFTELVRMVAGPSGRQLSGRQPGGQEPAGSAAREVVLFVILTGTGLSFPLA